MFRKLRHNLLAIFLFYTTTIAIVIFLSVIFIDSNSRINKIRNTTQNLKHFITADERELIYYFGFESRSLSYFETNVSESQKKHFELKDSIFVSIKKLRNTIKSSEVNSFQTLDVLENTFNKRETVIEKLIELSILRGYTDQGIEGRMLKVAKQLEAVEEISEYDLLKIRNYEKDYIIRNELKYVNEHSKFLRKIKLQIKENQLLDSARKLVILKLLNNYSDDFDELVNLDRLIGFRDNEGLKLELNMLSDKIATQIDILEMNVNAQTQKRYQYIKIIFSFIALLIFILTLIASLYMPRIVTRRISNLSRAVRNFVNSGFKIEHEIDIRSRKQNDEIGVLISNFTILRREIISLINDFQAKVEERTKDINLKREEIETQRDMLFANNEIIENQKDQLTRQNNDLLSSIRYAKRIQSALLPSLEIFEKEFAEYFIMNYPRDIVSGDFYWVKKIKYTPENELLLFAVADCTGHGVPGALMSMLGVAFLNEIVLKKEMVNPAEILNELRTSIVSVLQQTDNQDNKEGMDIALCCWDKKTSELHFAGANRPLYHVHNGELNIVKGDKIPIGGTPLLEKNFTVHTIHIDASDTIYLFSDGYTDQLGGGLYKKFKYNILKTAITQFHAKNIQSIENYLNLEFSKWQGHSKQTDDILMIGIRLL